jgi:hypothetical protein
MTEVSFVWLGKGFCTLTPENDQYEAGHRGAYVVFACQARDIVECCQQVRNELVEHRLVLVGFEYLIDQAHIDRELSTYERELIDRLGAYPVQFQNVHYFKGDA